MQGSKVPASTSPSAPPGQWFVYVSNAREAQVGKLVVVPAYAELGLPADPWLRPVKDHIRAGDRIWFFDSRKTPGEGIYCLCEVIGPFSDDRSHVAWPREYPRSYQWPVRVIANFGDNPILKKDLVEAAATHGWDAAPFTVQGHFKQGAVYCHEMSLPLAQSLAATRSSPKLDPRYRSLVAACLG